MLYLYLRAIHIISIVCWFSGLFYLPRLFAYQVESTNEQVIEDFKHWQSRLYYIIMIPSVSLTTLSGVGIIYLNGGVYVNATWFHMKMFCLLLLYIFHLRCNYHMYQLKHGLNIYSGKYFRIFNEIPSVLLIIMVVLAVVKPF